MPPHPSASPPPPSAAPPLPTAVPPPSATPPLLTAVSPPSAASPLAAPPLPTAAPPPLYPPPLLTAVPPPCTYYTLGPVGQFDVITNNEFIQILFTGQIHWICIININCAHGSVKVYDNLYTSLTPLTKLQIADLLQIQQSKKIDVLIQPVVAQTNSVDCGMYAIAYATSLCFGDDPCLLKFNGRNIRQHLWKCILAGKLTPFPSSIFYIHSIYM